ncbi:unnamed protein product [Ectocarpus sp. CCAP 1310/34]|nr:unnamed protein product [Ectocarpus sp. CCAP 1310/34]
MLCGIVYRRVVTLLSPIECSIDDIGSRIVTMREEVQAGIDRASDTRCLTRLVQGSVLPQVNGGAVEVAETFLKALPPEEGNALPPTTPSAVVVDTGGSGGAAAAATAGTAAAAAEAGGWSGGGGGRGGAKQPAATARPQQRFRPIALIKDDRAAELREVLREMLIEFLELCRQLVLKTRTVLNIPRNAPVVAPRAVGEERTAEEVNAEHNILWQGEMERGFSKMMQAMEVYLQEGEGWEDLKASTKNYAP